ncbi:hypothetical protein L083_1368 [Actinoplanes sp. N902-109]|nr:hypothetical protein L083_1368 [Actinoplanes sp. N902-109]
MRDSTSIYEPPTSPRGYVMRATLSTTPVHNWHARTQQRSLW